ncbi:putative serine/threonine-protein kinase iksA [Penicillium rolfsii]|nr:putative serine/threonine-protein kinase iksA [Penicillium rolfsii]
MPDDMSMIPYNGGNLDVVLRHNDSVVVYDHDSQQLALRNAADDHDGDLQLANCPLCHRPINEGSRGRHRGSADPEAEFINPNYFRMLNNSLPNSASSSRPSSPRRRLVRPALPDGPTSEPSSQPGANQGQGISSSAFSPDYFKRFFVEERVLGKGGKGVVLLVKHVLDGVSLGHFACKRVPVGDDHEWLEKVLGEVQLLQNLSHQNLVSYRHVWLENAQISTFGPSVPCAFIIQQYCNSGDLHNYICGGVQPTSTAQQLKDRLRRKSKGEPERKPEMQGPRVLQLDEIYSFFRDITAGLRHLHMNGYIHRDLKPNNCLLHETSDGIRVLVSDFGEVQSQNAMRKSTGATGTVSYCAPEVLRQEYPGGPFGNFTFKSDIFSLGMILYFLCFGELPYHSADIINEDNEDLDQLRDEITHWTGFDNARRRRPDLPAKLYSFLDQLLSVDPDRRPTADDVLNGIQAANNASENFRFKRNSSASPDLPGGARIRTVDSPVPPTSIERALSPIKKKIARSPASTRRDSLFDSSSGSSNTPASEAVLENRTSLSPDKDLVMRQRYSPASSNSSTRQMQPHEGPMDVPAQPISHTRQLLPPPPTSSTFLNLLGASTLFPGLQVTLFLVKVVTVLHPCSPVAVRPWFLYPLLLLAALTLRAHDLRVQALSTLAHVILVGLGMKLGVFCTWHSDYAMGV